MATAKWGWSVVKDFNPRRLPASIKYAARGIWHVLHTEQNAQIHLAATVVVITLAVVLQIGAPDFAILLLAIGFVVASEILNTVIEDFLDIIHPEHHPAIRRIKDALAGAVLLSAIIALAVGVVIFLPYFLAAFP